MKAPPFFAESAPPVAFGKPEVVVVLPLVELVDVPVPVGRAVVDVALAWAVLFDPELVTLNEFPNKTVRPADLTTSTALKFVRVFANVCKVVKTLLFPVVLRSS